MFGEQGHWQSQGVLAHHNKDLADQTVDLAPKKNGLAHQKLDLAHEINLRA